MRRSHLLVPRALVPVLAGLLTVGILPATVASAAPVPAAAPASVPQPPQHRGTPDRVAPAGLPADAGQSMPAATRVRELTDRRSAYGTVYEMSDGRMQAEASTSPVHYRDAQGRWQDVDTRVADSDRPGFAKAAVHSGFGSLFGDRSDRMLRVEIGGRHVELGLPGTPRTVTPAAAGSTVTYTGAVGSADLQYAVTASAVKERIVLRERPTGPVSYAFTVRGVQARQRADGTVEFARPAGGPVVFTLPRPVMFDGRKDPASPLGLA